MEPSWIEKSGNSSTVVIWRIVVIGAAITTLYTVQEEYSIHYTGGVQYTLYRRSTVYTIQEEYSVFVV